MHKMNGEIYTIRAGDPRLTAEPLDDNFFIGVCPERPDDNVLYHWLYRKVEGTRNEFKAIARVSNPKNVDRLFDKWKELVSENDGKVEKE